MDPVSYTHLDVYKRQIQNEIFAGNTAESTTLLPMLRRISERLPLIRCVVPVSYTHLDVYKRQMQGIQAWARANPAKLNELLNTNPSYVFFRELPGKANGNEGPPGALGVPLTAERSIAIDPRTVPLGAPVFLSTTQPNSNVPLQRLTLAQDTGGAIRGVVRADFFWGFGADPGNLAGRMKQSGQLWVLLPPGAAPK